VPAVITIGAAVAVWLVALVFVGPGGAVRHALVATVLVGVNAAGAFRAMWPVSLPAPAASPHQIRVRLAFGVLFGLLSGILTGDLLTCCLAGLLVGCVAAVLPGWTWRVRGAEATPQLTLRLNRRAFGAAAVQYGLVGGLLTGIVGSLLPGVADPFDAALTAAGVFAVAAALGAGLWTWARYRVIHLIAAYHGRLPWRLWRFLEDAHRRGAVRQAGTAWQFRHGLVQEYLADVARAWHSLYRLAPARTRGFTGVGAFFRSLAARRRAAKRRERAAKLREWSDRSAAEVYPNLTGDQDTIDQLRTMAEAGSPDATRQLAHLLAEQGWVDEAIAFLRTHPDAEWFQWKIADLLADTGRIDELRELASDDRYAAGRLAELLGEQGRLDEAEVLFRRLADTGSYRAALDLADLLAAHGRFDDAVRYLSTRRVDRYSRAWDLAKFYRANDRFDEAIATIRLTADRDPKAASYLVDLLAEKGGMDELRARSDARDHDAGRALARLLTEEGDVEEALAVLRTHAGDDAETAVMLAKELANHGRTEEALPLLRAHFAVGRTSVAVPLAQLLIRSGRVDDAKLILRSRVDAGDHMAQVLLEDLHRWE
jgi:thioredoxin-like negative regulator of GroEL